jgi:short-subunit dehydrogenase
MEVNFFAPTELIRLAVPLLRRGNQPAILNVASMCGRLGVPMWAEYSASKFALVGLGEALRAELILAGIHVLTVVPGLTRTNLERNLLHSDPRMYADFGKGMAPDNVAGQILQALRKNRRETVLGFEARWILRVNRLWPWLVDYFVRRVIRRSYG